MDDVKLLDNKCVIVFSQKHKTTKPGSHTELEEILEFRDNVKLCPVQHLRIDLEQTQSRRKGKQLFISYSKPFISYSKPHAPVGKQTFARWIKTVLASAGVDTEKYKAHSTHSASCSAGQKRACPYRPFSKLAAGPAKQCLRSFISKKSDQILAKFYWMAFFTIKSENVLIYLFHLTGLLVTARLSSEVSRDFVVTQSRNE